ncbi:hypothetical protein AB1Y20_012247 [Prymnesium parvum]|uniref:Uncharacterized protein n=1 Tax=Prymnesium parvum TaxID=97485 RepID=A0AB34IQ16_PRYPA
MPRCSNCCHFTQRLALPQLDGECCSECLWVTSSSHALRMPADAQRRRLTLFTRPSAFSHHELQRIRVQRDWAFPEYRPVTHPMGASSVGLESVQRFRSCAVMEQQAELTKLTEALRKKGIAVSCTALEKGTCVPQDRPTESAAGCLQKAHKKPHRFTLVYWSSSNTVAN